MSSKTIRVNLFEIDKAIQEVESYKSALKRKTDIFRKRIAETIEQKAQAMFSVSVADDLLRDGQRMSDTTVTVENEGNNVSVVIARGSDVLFVEFGAGVYHNSAVGTSPHPQGMEFGYTIGSYGKGRGRNQTWGFTDETGTHVTHGTPASMPMFNATKDVLSDIYSIAKEVFG